MVKVFIELSKARFVDRLRNYSNQYKKNIKNLITYYKQSVNKTEISI